MHGLTLEGFMIELATYSVIFRRFINSHNRANLGYTLAVNHLADMTPEELRALRGRSYSPGYNGGKPFPYNVTELSTEIPESHDWRIYGAVTPVKGTFIFENSLRGKIVIMKNLIFFSW